ncbi:MAG TPA: hypothetical protein VHS33_10270 [Sphingomicrobium sp.]|jgi:hypothetical protein|nr:hypothetical protein [Sphingomicrobium sp.]
MDRFSFFFSFYGLILGFAVAELLSGFAGMVRAHALKKLEAQTALTALLTLIAIVATWVDAFSMERSLTLDFRDLWAPIVVAIVYYLAAAVIFPRDSRQYGHLRAYFAARRKFVIGLLFAAELVDIYVNRAFYMDTYIRDPARFWGWLMPYNVLIKGGMLALFLVRGRRATIALLVVEIFILLVPYWQIQFSSRLMERLFGY